MSLKISVIYGSVRENRQGIKAAKFFVNKLKEKGHDVTLIDPIEYNLPLINKRYSDYKEERPPEMIEKLSQIFKESDAFVIVTAEYNHGTPPALKNILDHFHKEQFGYKPAAIVSYSQGGFGGVRSAVQWRSILGELQMITIPKMFPIPKVQEAFDEKGNPLDDSFNKRIEKFIPELEWYAQALKEKRQKGLPD